MADPAKTKLADLTRALHEKTRDGEIIWAKTSLDGVFAASLGNYTIRIAEEPGQSSQSDIVIRIFNLDGTIADTFSDVTLSGVPIDGYSGYYDFMVELYNYVSRQASGADKAVDEILKMLK